MSKFKTLFRLGVGNVARVGVYRLGLKCGLHPAIRAVGLNCLPPFFNASAGRSTSSPFSELDLNPDWLHQGCWFGKHRFAIDDSPPDWFQSPFTAKRVSNPNRPWWKIQDFDVELGDIKEIWELSRFDWVIAMAQHAVGSTSHNNPEIQQRSIERLNAWLENWARLNPCYQGPNWKCGQEASIRVLHLILAAHFLDQLNQPTAGLVNLIESHLRRIAPTISYAVGQSNNHATSEAAALFIGGDWLARQGRSVGTGWSRAGRHWLDNRARRLIGDDGTFSQYSVNYHRLMLDTYSLARWWQLRFKLAPFEDRTQRQLGGAIDWLALMVDPETGDAPNLGPNDGANLLPLTSADYRDYRPAVNLASFLWRNRLVFKDARSLDHLRWLSLDPSLAKSTFQPPDRSNLLGRNGFCVLGNSNWKAVLRYPDDRFRPSQADALHVDFWADGVIVLRDAGSYSYFLDDKSTPDFKGTSAHNTVQFDQRDQMPYLSRFLYGQWLTTERWSAPQFQNGLWSVAAGYTDSWGASHCRSIQLTDRELVVEDQIAGFKKLATLRWRLNPADWSMTFSPNRIHLRSSRFLLTIDHDRDITRAEIVMGWESRYYRDKTELPVLEIETRNSGKFKTRLTRNS